MNPPIVPISLLNSWQEASQHFRQEVSILVDEEIYAFNSPVDDAFLNWVWCKNPNRSNIKKIDDFFQGKHHIYYLDFADPSIISAAYENNLVAIDSFPQLVFDLEIKQPKKNLTDTLEFKTISSLEELEIWSKTFCKAYEAYDYKYIMKFFIPFFSCKTRPLLAMGIYNETPICTGMLFQNKQNCSIMGISTIKSSRNNGYGTAISNFLLQTAKKNGAQKVALNATPNAIRVYKNIGFLSYINEKVFLPKKFVQAYTNLIE